MNVDTRTTQYANGVALGDWIIYIGPTFSRMGGPDVYQNMTGTVRHVGDGSVRDVNGHALLLMQPRDGAQPVWVRAAWTVKQ